MNPNPQDLAYEKSIVAHIQITTQVLDTFATKSNLELSDFFAIERALQVLIESLIGVSRYILKIKCNILVSKTQEAFHKLYEQNLITDTELTTYQKMAGYRNILVHDYLNLNPAITREVLESGQYKTIQENVIKLLKLLEA